MTQSQRDGPVLVPEQKSVQQAADELYERLATPFDVTFRDLRGGVELEYATGEQVVSRLNEELGFLNWEFTIIAHGINAEADEVWVLGQLRVWHDGRWVVRQQFGSQKLKRSRSTGNIMDLGFDLKGAATDALKKCASLIGVGLYLWKKEGGISHVETPQAEASTTRQSTRQPEQPQAPAPRPITPAKPLPVASADRETLITRFDTLLEQARDKGYTGPLSGTGIDRMTDIQIELYGKQLENWLTQRRPVVVA